MTVYYFVNGMTGDMNSGRDYFPLQEKAMKAFPDGIIAGIDNATYVFQVNGVTVVLSASSGGGWAPRFDMFQDSKAVVGELESKLNITLRSI